MNIIAQLAIGLVLSGLVGLAAYRRGSLSRSGVAGAMIVGTAIFGFGGLAWGLTLITFFVTSSLLSHYKEAVKEKLAEKFDKGHRRDLGQALANGGAGALIAVGYAIRPDPVLLAAFAGAMATVNADTWATELGVLNKRPPRLITTFTEVEAGTSGAVSPRGTLAALGGAALIGVALFVLMQLECTIATWGGKFLIDPCAFHLWQLSIVLIATPAGLGGALFDSLLGATVQAIYFCPKCQKETEKRIHTCGTPTDLRRGWRWLNNDMVNFVSSAVGAGIAAGLWRVVGG